MPTRICCVQRLCVRVRQFLNILQRRRGTHSHACGSSPHQTGCPGLASLSRPSPLGLPAGADNALDSREEKLLMCFCLKLFLQLYTKVASVEAVAPLDFLWDASWRPFCGTGGLGSFVGGETKLILSPRPQLSAALGPGVPDPVSSWPWPHRATACPEVKQRVL